MEGDCGIDGLVLCLSQPLPRNDFPAIEGNEVPASCGRAVPAGPAAGQCGWNVGRWVSWALVSGLPVTASEALAAKLSFPASLALLFQENLSAENLSVEKSYLRKPGAVFLSPIKPSSPWVTKVL